MGAENHPDFHRLVEDLETLLQVDPNRILDYDNHPRIYEQAVEIGFDILKSFGGTTLQKSTGSAADTPWVKDAPGDNVIFVNPNTVYFGASVYSSGAPNPDDIFILDAKESLVNFKFGWPPVYLTSPTETPLL